MNDMNYEKKSAVKYLGSLHFLRHIFKSSRVFVSSSYECVQRTKLRVLIGQRVGSLRAWVSMVAMGLNDKVGLCIINATFPIRHFSKTLIADAFFRSSGALS